MFGFLSNRFSSLFSRITGSGQLTEKKVQEALEGIQETLLEADVPHELVQAFCQQIKQEVVGQKLIGSLKPGEHLAKIVHDKVTAFLGDKAAPPFTFLLPAVVMVMGLQGSGKTTTLAKLAHFVQKQAITFSFQSNPIIANHTGGIIGGISRK